MPMINRNQPNSFLSSCAETWEARIEPKMAPGIPDKIKRKVIEPYMPLECTKTACQGRWYKGSELIPGQSAVVSVPKDHRRIKIVPPDAHTSIKPDTTPIIKQHYTINLIAAAIINKANILCSHLDGIR